MVWGGRGKNLPCGELGFANTMGVRPWLYAGGPIEFRLRSSLVRAIVLNDTRSEDHIGCQLVMRNLLEQCSRRGIDVVASLPNSQLDDLPFVKAHLHEFELLIVNGEGTLHHDCPKALSLCQAAQYADAQGKKAVLINTVWQDNDQLHRFLPSFQLVAARESRSQAAIVRVGPPARLVPDLVFATSPPTSFSPRATKATVNHATVVIDSVDRQTTLRWAWRAVIRRFGMFVMHPTNYERLARRPLLMRALAPIGRTTADNRRQFRGTTRLLLTGHLGAIPRVLSCHVSRNPGPGPRLEHA